MKVQEIVQLTKPNLPGTARSVAADQTVRTADRVGMPNSIVGRQVSPGSRDIFTVADPNDEVTGELPPALDLSRISVPKTPHTRELDYIKTQIVLLPTQTEQ
jgi:hypothetical protein